MPASSFVNRDHAGGAVDTTISPGISGTDLSIVIADATGWPTGGANGPFHVIVSYDVAGKEKIEVQSRTGTTLTIADTGKRGIDGTSAATHAVGAKIRHCYTAIDAQEANDHITNTGLDHHTQYLNSARHAAINHTAAMIGADEVGTSEIAPLAVTSAELASGAVTAGKIAVGGISAANQFAAGVVDAAAIATDAVGSAEIATDAVGTAEIAALAVTSSELAAASVVAGKIASGGVSTTAEIANAIVTLAKLASDAVPSASNAQVLTAQTTTSTSYVDLATVGPSVTLTPPASGKVKVTVYCSHRSDDTGGLSLMSFALSGGNTVAAVDDNSVGHVGNTGHRNSSVFLLTGLAASSTTFTAKYRSSGGGSTSTFEDRKIIVEPVLA